MNLKAYAELALKIGVNLQKGDLVYINVRVEEAEYARAIAALAYEMGADSVTVSYRDNVLDRLFISNADIDIVKEIPRWRKMQKNEVARKKGVNIYIVSDEPSYLQGVDSMRLAAYSKACSRAFREYHRGAMNNDFRWLVYPAPSMAWAKRIFPDLNGEQALMKLEGLIEKTLLLDTEQPLQAWESKISEMQRRADILNEAELRSLHYKNSLGTDFTVGMPEKYYFSSAREYSRDGVPFVANMPTEEIFSVPHRMTAQGTLVATKPLVYQGNIIDGISFTFKNGRVVSFSAAKGYENLAELLRLDDGVKYLGEIALVGHASPISDTGVLFFETLFDENASCHFALGDSYPLVTDREELDTKQRKIRGLNKSNEHEDFMVGSKDLTIIGTRADGSKMTIFKDGNFAF